MLNLNFFGVSFKMAYFKPNTVKSYHFMHFLCFKASMIYTFHDNKIVKTVTPQFCVL